MRLYKPALLSLALSFMLFAMSICLREIGQGLKGPAGETVSLAQDVWGGRHQLTSLQKGTALLYPFSPSTCGYCMVEGEFVRENYYRNARENGQAFYGISPHSPQIEIYSYMKQYHVDYPVLTAPMDLQRYHSGGYPWLVVLKDGQCVFNRLLIPYGNIFDAVNKRIWNDEASLRLPSGLKMAVEFVVENQAHQAVYVLPDSSPDMDRIRERLKENHQSVTLKYESRLTEKDLQKHLFFDGRIDQFSARHLGLLKAPIALSPGLLRVGPYVFDTRQVGVTACVPNPFHRERYMIVDVRGAAVQEKMGEPWLDYTVYRSCPDGKGEVLLHGWFRKDKGGWRWDDALAFGPAKTGDSTPWQSQPGDSGKTIDMQVSTSRSSQRTQQGRRWTLGEKECRFPRLALDKQDRCWATWEEAGGIKIARLDQQGDATMYTVEGGAHDSYNPVVVCAGDQVWSFYIADTDGVYRLYGRRLHDTAMSERFLVSDTEPANVIMPAATVNRHGKVLIAWSSWKVNQRYLRYRLLDANTCDGINDVVTVKSVGEFTCAWAPSVVLSDTGEMWGAWNQHYPAVLCVCAGALTEKTSIITSATTIRNSTDGCGGYPAVAMDGAGKRWVFWESFPPDSLKGTPQEISGAYYDTDTHSWSQPQIISRGLDTRFNQTPRAFTDSQGAIWVIWSGRLDDKAAWGVFVSCLDSGRWSLPQRLSEEKEEARAPDCAVDSGQRLWAAWHTGTGADMRIRVVMAQIQKEGQGTMSTALK